MGQGHMKRSISMAVLCLLTPRVCSLCALIHICALLHHPHPLPRLKVLGIAIWTSQGHVVS